jgi:type VI secretion system protein ImpJ
MFLRPHHLQAAQRYAIQDNQLNAKWDLHYNWGLRTIELDIDALANHRLLVHSLQARLRDGTLVSISDDGSLPSRELRSVLESSTTVTVYLAVPMLRLGKDNVSANGAGDAGRFLLTTEEVEDENKPGNPQPLQMRQLNLRFLVSGEDQAGYEVMEIARVEKSMDADATPQLDAAFIPPILACDAWKVLRVDILRSIYERIGKKIDLLAGQVLSRGISIGSQASGDALIVGQLDALNQAYALLGVLVNAKGIHPLHAYLELCRLVGQLAIFGESRRPPDLPPYDHDDLGGCFYRVKHELDDLLNRIIEPDWKQRPFEGIGKRMQVPLELTWLEPSWQMFVGVKSPLIPEDCVKLLTKAGQLDMKIGSGATVDKIFERGQMGLKFTHSPLPPRSLPSIQGLTYFQVSRDSQLDEWKNVQSELTLAVRLNENRIDGSIERQRTLKIRSAGQNIPLEFTLYVVRGS